MLRAGLLLMCASLAGAAFAQAPASKPIRFIVPYAPGAINDVVARTLAAKMAEEMGTPVVVDNRAGGGTIIGTELAARSAPDGRTLLLTSVALPISPALHRKLPFNVQKDFAQVTLVGFAPFVLVVHPGLPAKSAKELVALAKAKPGQLSYGSSGIGGGAHLAMEMLKSMTGTNITHVPYKGAAPALVDVISGQTHMTMATMVAVGAHVKAGRVRAIAVTSRQRYSIAPELETIAESCCPGYDATPWWGVAVPAATPKPLIAQLNSTIVKILRMPDVTQRFSSQGVDLIASSPGEAEAHMKEQLARWGKVVKEAGVTAE